VSRRARLSRILTVFGWIGLTSLGAGRSVYFHDALVVKRPWITSREFVQDLTLSQLLPGPNFSNLAVAIGARLAGWRGAAVGAAALIVPGALILLAVSALYFRIGLTPNLSSAMHGAGAAVVGLVLVTTLGLIRTSIRRGRELLVAGTIFVLVGPLHVHTVLAVLLVAPLSLWMHRPRRGDGS
jgi:chromate transporter